MDNYFKFYWITRLDHIHVLSSVMIGVSLFLLASLIINSAINEELHFFVKVNKKRIRALIITAAIFANILVFLPTKQEAVEIYAVGKTLDFAQSDTSLQKIPYQATEVISKYLEKSANEIEKEVK